jgi:hypothetical protein
MKVVIEVGKVNRMTPIFNWSGKTFLDDCENQLQSMYNFLLNCGDDNCIINNADMYLLYALNNGFLANEVKDNPDITDKSDRYHKIPKFDPNKYRIYEVSENGEKKNLQTESGTITDNYYDKLMGKVMDDFYVSLNYLEGE